MNRPIYPGPRHRWRTRLVVATFRAALDNPSADKRPVLDAGCGTGTASALLARGGYRVWALDVDAGRLAAAREVVATGMVEATAEIDAASIGGAAGNTTGRVRLVQADLTALPLADDSMAGAIAGEVLEHIAADGAAVAELARVLVPGGVLVLTVPADASRLGAADVAVGHVRRYEYDRLAALLQGAGLDLITLRPWGFPFGRIYDRWIQRPALAWLGERTAIGQARRPQSLGLPGLWGLWMVWLGKLASADPFWRFLFEVDEVVARTLVAKRPSLARRPWGSGWLAVARKPPDRRD